MSNLLMIRRSESALCEWIMYFLGKVQSDLTQETTKDNTPRNWFPLDLFMSCIVIVAGCDIFINEELSVKNKMNWLKKFPEALWLLSKRSNWNSHMPRVRSVIIIFIIGFQC